jgi:hypothetical protein
VNLKLDRQTVLLLVSMLGGAGTATKLSADIADIRERVARIEARLDYAAGTASVDLAQIQR